MEKKYWVLTVDPETPQFEYVGSALLYVAHSTVLWGQELVRMETFQSFQLDVGMKK